MHTAETSAPVEVVPADVLVLFHLEDEPAPRGRLGRVDWLLCGAVSRLRVRGKFRGERGSRALLLTDSSLQADRVMVVGLGRRADCTLNGLYRLSYEVAAAVLDLECSTIALDIPARAFPQEPPERIRRAFLEGFLAELKRGRPEAAMHETVLT
jgi:hypothetical protein